MRTRDWRRAQRFRIREKAKRILRTWGSPLYPYTVEEQVGYMADNMQKCSCYMCGNPRKQFGEKTIQERKQEDFEVLLRRIETEVQREMVVFPETITWDHLPKPVWRNIKLREDND